MHGGSRGEATHSSHSVLLQDLQGLGPFTTSCQHHLRLQGKRGDLFAGKQLVNEKEDGSTVWGKTGYELIQINIQEMFGKHGIGSKVADS